MRRMLITLIAAALLLSPVFAQQPLPVPGLAQRDPLPSFTEEIYADGLSSPTAMAWAPDGRLFIAEKGGDVRVVSAAGVLLPTPFVTLTVDSAGERGLIGIALDPDFANNGYVYLHFTEPADNGNPPRGRINRYTAAGDVSAPGSKQNIVFLDYSSGATNHNGGAIHFGTDGKLYIGVGDTANGANSQSMTTRHGKLLRYNSDGTIPTDNPFYGTATGENRSIWALGLRNPFTFAVHPNTGRDLHQRRRPQRRQLRGSQSRRGGGQLRLAGLHRAEQRPGLYRPDLQLSARVIRLYVHRGRRVLCAGFAVLSSIVSGRLLLQRLLLRRHLGARQRHGRCLNVRRGHARRGAGRFAGGAGRRAVLRGLRQW
ncbi:MAG: hypothetical protein HND48_20500 [Chloroflexi bacterium]|nr:hypothetical protein [Chloroflexota bacterium]